MQHPAPIPPPRQALLIAAFLAVYIIWGSTYMAIRCGRWKRFRRSCWPPRGSYSPGSHFWRCWKLCGSPMPTRLHWRNAFIAGNLMLVGGNGLVVWAEQTVPSGRAALVIATTPAWFALMEWLRPGGTRPKLQTVIGIAIGFAGVSLLIGSAPRECVSRPVAGRRHACGCAGDGVVGRRNAFSPSTAPNPNHPG